MPSNFSRRSQRKKQTRLAFAPVEPSSSTAMSPARIRYNMPSSPGNAFDLTSPTQGAKDAKQSLIPSDKKFAVIVETPKKERKDGKLPFEHLATPAESSQPHISNTKSANSISDYSDSDLDVVAISSRRRGSEAEKRGTPLFGFLSSGGSRPSNGSHKFLSSHKKRLPGSYDGAEDDSSAGSPPEEDNSSARRKPKQAKARKRPPTLQSTTTSDNDSDIESPLASPTRATMVNGLAVLPNTQSPPDTKSLKTADTRSLISGGNVNLSQKVKKTPQNKNAKGITKPLSNKRGRKQEDVNACSDDEDAIAILPTPRQTGQHKTTKKKIIISDDSEDLEVAPQTSQKRSGRSLNWTNDGVSEDGESLASSRMKESTNRNRRVSIASEEGDGEEDIIIQSLPRRRLRASVKEKSLEHDTDDDDEDPISSPLKRRRVNFEDNSGGDPFTSPAKRFRPGLVGQSSANSNTSRKTTRITRQKQQQKKPHRTAREKKLELLRRQRAGEKIIELTSSESDDDQKQIGLYDSNSDLEVLSEFEDEEKDENEGIEEVRRSLLSSNQNNNDDDFVVDDDNDPLGVPELGLNDIPLQFTHHAHKPLKEHFRDAVEWMIQNKINPAFNRNDPIYVQAFRKLDTEVQGYAHSIYSSTVWKEAFRRALWARPVFSERALTPGDDQERNKCDACGRTNHPATYEVQFSGKAYYKETLDEVDNDHGDDDDDDEDDSRSMTSVNSTGQSIPGVDVSWFVGRFCKGNAQTAHSLIHWKHALNEWVVDRLKSDGHLEGPKLAEREDWSTSKRGKFANGIVDEWQGEGEVKALYRDFKINLDVAREGKATRWGK